MYNGVYIEYYYTIDSSITIKISCGLSSRSRGRVVFLLVRIFGDGHGHGGTVEFGYDIRGGSDLQHLAATRPNGDLHILGTAR